MSFQHKCIGRVKAHLKVEDFGLIWLRFENQSLNSTAANLQFTDKNYGLSNVHRDLIVTYTR